MDLVDASPLVGLGPETFAVGHATLKAKSRKVVKHKKACSDNQFLFIPFTFETFGFLAQEVINLLPKIQRVMHNNVVSLKSMNLTYVFVLLVKIMYTIWIKKNDFFLGYFHLFLLLLL